MLFWPVFGEGSVQGHKILEKIEQLRRQVLRNEIPRKKSTMLESRDSI